MHLHEYQAKQILLSYGLPVPEFAVASSVEEAVRWEGAAVIKIQVHAGGRGKAGGVKFAKTKEEIQETASSLLGMKMVNNQTGEEGVVAHKLILTRPVEIAKEYYLAALIDRKAASPVLIASAAGGMDIEEQSPDQILKIPFRSDGTLKPYQLLKLAKFMGWNQETAKQGADIATKLARCFIEKDAALLEINPLVETQEGHLVLLDAKMSLDENALFRHKDLAALYDPSQDSPQEAEAKKYDLAYVAMQGEIGCMVNGAGLAMATMDLIALTGKRAANFLDVGGSATKEKVAEGFHIILQDPKVSAIFVNIFGGIMNCATIAEGVVSACLKQTIPIPIIVRMEGTNVEEGKRILKQSGLKILVADDMQQANSYIRGEHGNSH